MSVKQHLVTAEAFYEMPDLSDKRLDLVGGQVVEKPLLGAQAAFANANLLFALAKFVEQHDCGIVLPGVGHVLHRDPDTVRHVGISFNEHQDDVYLSTLLAHIEALGSELEITARFSDDEVIRFS